MTDIIYKPLKIHVGCGNRYLPIGWLHVKVEAGLVDRHDPFRIDYGGEVLGKQIGRASCRERVSSPV